MKNDLKDKKIFLTTLSPKTHRTSEENLGIGYLKSSLQQAGYSVQIIDAWLNELEINEVYNRIIANIDNMLFVGISTYMSNIEPSIELIKKLKEYNKNIKIVCGGFGPTFEPERFLKNGSDYIIRGEGEKVICLLADAIYNNSSVYNIPSLGYLDNNIIKLNNMMCLNDNLDLLPFPSRDTMEIVMKNKSTVNMVTCRGCTGNCEFCSVVSFFRLAKGRIWRTRSIENIVDEIEHLNKCGVTHIKMVDDSFVDGNRDEIWCEKFANEIKKRNIDVRLRGQIRADKVSDKILYELKRAGFFSFACGIENGSQSALSRMNKSASINDNIKALELFKKYNYIVQMGYILFDRETTIQELIENYYFLKKYDFAVTKGIFSEMYSAEGTKLNDKLRSQGVLISNGVGQNNQYVIKNDDVRFIYNALKLWHKSHSHIYDMTIDPVISPKAIDEKLMKEFYKLIMDLKRRDLDFLKFILFDNDDNVLSRVVNNKISENQEYYKQIDGDVKKLYKKANLKYNANINPFL